VLVLDNIRSIYNVGSIFRTADGSGIDKIYLCGITAYPEKDNDPRKPWEAETISNKIAKTALGAEASVPWEYYSSSFELVSTLITQGFTVLALEKTPISHNIYELDNRYFQKDLALIVGNEVQGVSEELLRLSNEIIHIPMKGVKSSLNVSIASAIALYEIKRRLTTYAS
jgi:tRNA G18 (ribose-2'-O)-methylase SpoU